jgi:regulator of protease activity HflC (stomatin/prohibitin superfamily)
MASGIVIVKQYERMVVLKWGRLDRIAAPGFRFLIPLIYNGRQVDLREQVVRVPTQKYITKDNVVVDMDFVLYYRVLPDQAEKSVLEVADHHVAVRKPGSGGVAVYYWQFHPGRCPGRTGADAEPASGGAG